MIDATPPALTVPANITVSATADSGVVVDYTATATDLVDEPVAPVCAPPSGAVFRVGTTPVACSATDTHGNVAAASFTVTVLAPAPPPTQNSAPVASGDSYTIGAGTTLTSVLRASDAEGDALTFILVTPPKRGRVVIDPATGAFTYTPSRSEGRDQFSSRQRRHAGVEPGDRHHQDPRAALIGRLPASCVAPVDVRVRRRGTHAGA